MHPVGAGEPLGVDRSELRGRAAVGDHGALADGVDEDDDRPGATAALHLDVDGRRRELAHQCVPERVVSHTADET